jgi:hypothetical protein
MKLGIFFVISSWIVLINALPVFSLSPQEISSGSNAKSYSAGNNRPQRCSELQQTAVAVDTSVYSVPVDMPVIPAESGLDIVRIYPNPAHELLKIVSETEIITILLINLDGESILRFEGQLEKSFCCPLNELENDLYFARVITQKGTFTLPFTKN